MKNVKNIRDEFVTLYKNNNFVIDKTGCKTIEIIGAEFIADEETIFGALNYEYMKNELDWYLSQSLNVYDLKDTPKIWKDVADKNGNINSNYGWCVFSEANGSQYLNCLHELIKNPFSRRAVMIYNRPQMWEDYKKDGMNEFMCTFTTQYFIRDNKLISIIMMRSGDSVFGYKNDKAWQDYVTNKLYQDLKEFYPQLEKGNMIWKTNSLHVYENHLFLVDHYSKTGIFNISKKEYEQTKTN